MHKFVDLSLAYSDYAVKLVHINRKLGRVGCCFFLFGPIKYLHYPFFYRVISFRHLLLTYIEAILVLNLFMIICMVLCLSKK